LRSILRDFNHVDRIARNQFIAREFKARQGPSGQPKSVAGTPANTLGT
jgi:hypothetical protein